MWSPPANLSLETLNDVYQIEQVVYRYATVQDGAVPDRFGEVFAPGAELGRGKHTTESWAEASRGIQTRLNASQHFKTNVSITVEDRKSVV